MGKIYYDSYSIKNYVNSGLEKSISFLKTAKSIANSLDIPYGFDYRSSLKSLDDKIKEDLKIIEEIYSKINSDAKEYAVIADNLNADISKIDNYSISLRQSAIR